MTSGLVIPDSARSSNSDGHLRRPSNVFLTAVGSCRVTPNNHESTPAWIAGRLHGTPRVRARLSAGFGNGRGSLACRRPGGDRLLAVSGGRVVRSPLLAGDCLRGGCHE